jgi:hypothetical protein
VSQSTRTPNTGNVNPHFQWVSRMWGRNGKFWDLLSGIIEHWALGFCLQIWDRASKHVEIRSAMGRMEGSRTPTTQEPHTPCCLPILLEHHCTQSEEKWGSGSQLLTEGFSWGQVPHRDRTGQGRTGLWDPSYQLSHPPPGWRDPGLNGANSRTWAQTLELNHEEDLAMAGLGGFPTQEI